MNIAEKYIQMMQLSLLHCHKKQFRDGMGWTLACPFCRDAQKRESKINEKCASLYPVEGTFTYFFSCNRGLNGGVQGVHSCNHTMRFSTFLKKWIHRNTRGMCGRRSWQTRTINPSYLISDRWGPSGSLLRHRSMPWSCDLSTLMEVIAHNQCLAGLLPLLRQCLCLRLGRLWLSQARTL